VNGTRRPLEVAVVVWRRAPQGAEYLVVLRSPERQGYWHLIAGGVDWGEEPEVAARRELREETGLDAEVAAIGLELGYGLEEEPPEVRARFAPEVTSVSVVMFLAEAPAGWEPVLDREHVAHRWCSAEDAVRQLRWPEPRAAVRAAAAVVEGGR
jgi:8-oxo-dGTP pyrophosphatase MutT (NUDIX family)